MAGNETVYITVGKIGAPYGVRGWVKVQSFTELIENLLDYKPWYLCKQPTSRTGSPQTWIESSPEEAKIHGKGIIAKFTGCDDRDAAALLRGQEIAIRRDQLPEPEEGEYYWVDLEGLEVLTLNGDSLGRIDHMMETGANDVMVVKGERQRLIPFVLEHIVREVNIEGGFIRVDWDPDFE